MTHISEQTQDTGSSTERLVDARSYNHTRRRAFFQRIETWFRRGSWLKAIVYTLRFIIWSSVFYTGLFLTADSAIGKMGLEYAQALGLDDTTSGVAIAIRWAGPMLFILIGLAAAYLYLSYHVWRYMGVAARKMMDEIFFTKYGEHRLHETAVCEPSEPEPAPRVEKSTSTRRRRRRANRKK